MAGFGRTKSALEISRVGIRGQIIGMSRAGLGPSQICHLVGCSKRTVQRWIKRYVNLIFIS